jgi:hypothetical protein
MKKIAVTTWVTDDYRDFIGVEELKNSFKYFHPDIDFFIFDTKLTNEAKEKDPWLNPVWMMPPSCLSYVEDYDMVVHIDGDCVVTGPLTELFESEEDLIGVRNNNSLNKASSHRGITIAHLPPFGDGTLIPVQNFINAGLIASNNKQFWYDWHELNREAYRIKTEVNSCYHGLGDEQDTLNQIFHSSRYTSKVIDAIGTGLSYGLCNTWGEETHWDSWNQLYVDNDCLYLDDPVDGARMKVKVLHQAGGSLAGELNRKHGTFRNWLKQTLKGDVLNYVNKVSELK